MARLGGRPIGITVLAVVLAVNGIAALAGAFGVADYATRRALSTSLTALGVPAIAASTITGLLLLRRAYLLWTLHRGAWGVTLVLASIAAVSALASIVAAPLVAAGWFSLAASVAIVLYLPHPNVRVLFS